MGPRRHHHRFGPGDQSTAQRLSLVVDDLAKIDPWAPRGIEIRGIAQALTDANPPRPGFPTELIRIKPTRVLGWGLDRDAFAPPNAGNVRIRDPR